MSEEKKRYSKKERKELKKPDAFVGGGRQLLAKLMSQPKRLLQLGVGLVVLGLAVYGYNTYKHMQLEASWLAYFEATQKPEAEKWQALEAFYGQGAKNRARFLAAVELADHHYEAASQPDATADKAKASTQAAAEWYGKALEYSGLVAAEEQLLRINVGAALEMQGLKQEALVEYQAAAKMDARSKAWALIQVGRVFESQEKPAEARQAYQQVVENHGTTEYGKMAKNYLRRLDSSLMKEIQL